MAKKTVDKFREALEKCDWEGVARAFQESDMQWHAAEWKVFVEEIRATEAIKCKEEIVKEGLRKINSLTPWIPSENNIEWLPKRVIEMAIESLFYPTRS